MTGADGQAFEKHRWQFSIRRLLAVTLGAAVLLALGRLWTQLMVFLAVTFLTFYSSWVFARALRRKRWRWAIALGLVAIVAWGGFYVASIGPVVAVVERLYPGEWVEEPLQSFYAPVFWWGNNNLPLSDMLKSYVFWWLVVAGGYSPPFL